MSARTRDQIDAFLSDTLQGEALEAFELALLDDPELARMVAARRTELGFINDQLDRGGAPSEDATEATRPTWLERLAEWFRPPAVVGFAVGAGMVFVLAPQLRENAVDPGVVPVLGEVVLEASRSARPARSTVALPALAVVDPGIAVEAAAFQIEFRDESNRELYPAIAVVPDQDGLLKVLMPPPPWAVERIELTVLANEEVVARHSIRIE